MLGVVVAGGVAAGVGLLYPNTGSKKETFDTGKVVTIAPEAPSRPLGRTAQHEADRVLSRFVLSAVLRRHLDDSYGLVTDNLREGMSLRDWRTGDIPVVPFPVGDYGFAKSKLIYSRPAIARYDVVIFARPKARTPSEMFNAELHLVTRGHERRWLVDYWMPVGGGINTPTPPSAAARAPIPDPPSLSLAWIFVPLGILGTIVLVPIGLGVRGWLRTRRSIRAYETGYGSGTRPS